MICGNNKKLSQQMINCVFTIDWLVTSESNEGSQDGAALKNSLGTRLVESQSAEAALTHSNTKHRLAMYNNIEGRPTNAESA